MEKDCQLLSTARALKLADRKILARKGLWSRRTLKQYKRLARASVHFDDLGIFYFRITDRISVT